MESEQSQNFNERLSRWVADQGFWFQLRYSMAGSGSKGTALFHLLRMAARLLVFLLFIAIGIFIYLMKRTGTEGFADNLRESLKAGISAEEVEMGGQSHSHNELTINRLACQGGENTFFDSLEARNIRMRMTLLDGVVQDWDTGTVFISRLDMVLRAGADDAASAKSFGDALFRQSKDVTVSSMDIADASIRWGYSERTRGAIANSELRVRRLGDTIRLDFQGGTFSQNWLHKLEIVGLTVICDRSGFVFSKAEFRLGQATVNLTGLKLVAGERPTVAGRAKIRKLALETALPPAARNFLEGTISGDFQVSGTTNQSDGIGFAGKVSLDDTDDVITLRDKLHVLKALSDVDYVRNYKRVDFREGSFSLKTGGGGMEIADLHLKSDEIMTIDGAMRVRLPTPEEARAALQADNSGDAPAYPDMDALDSDSGSGGDFSLRRAGLETKREKDGNKSVKPVSLFDRLGLNVEMRRLEEEASERASRTLRYEGKFVVTIPGDAFDEAPTLAEKYPKDPVTGRISVPVPIEGTLYEVTFKQMKELYELGRRRK